MAAADVEQQAHGALQLRCPVGAVILAQPVRRVVDPPRLRLRHDLYGIKKVY